MGPILEAIDTLVGEITTRMQRGDKLSPEVQAELALTLNDVAELINSQSQAVAAQPPPVPATAISTAGEEQSVNLLWMLANANPEVFTQFVQTYPDPSLSNLANNPARIQVVIERLRQQRPPALPEEVIDGVPTAPIGSSNIFGFKYNPGTRKLTVKFQGNGAYGAGPVYEYDGVPPPIADIFMKGAHPAKTSGSSKFGQWWKGKVPSLGSAMHHFIKLAGFPYKKVSG